MNLTGDDLRAYIEVFHQSLVQGGARYLPPGQQRSLLRHVALLPAKIRAHVSSTFGFALEYEPARETSSVEVNEGPERVEDLLLKAPAWARELPPSLNVDGPNYAIRKRPLARGYPFRLGSERASLVLEDVSVQVGPWKRAIAYAEVYGNRDADLWTVEKAHARANTEVLIALIHLRNAGQREMAVDDYLAQFRDKMVVLLGGPEGADAARLQALAESLRAFHYEPVQLADIPSDPPHDLWETLRAIGGGARFALVDGSADAARQVALCRDQGWLTAPVAPPGEEASLPPDVPGDNVLSATAYDPADPSTAVLQVLRRLEARREEIEGRMRG